MIKIRRIKGILSKKTVFAFMAAIIMFACTNQFYACSVSFLENGESALVARNMDWPSPEGVVVKNERGTEKTALFPPADAKPYIWQAIYGSITFDLIMEMPGVGILRGPGCGLNEEGFYAGALFCDPPVYPGPQGKPALRCAEVVRVLLDTCSTVKEAIDKFDDFGLTPMKVGDEELTFHWFLADKNGDCAIIEFPPEFNGKMAIHTPPLFKCTTNEYYEWSYYYLYQYEDFNKETKEGLKPFPSDTHKRTSDIRFVRNCKFSQEVLKKETISVDDGFYVMGKVAQTEGTKGSTSPTDWTIVYDLNNLEINWTAANNTERRFIDMKKVNFDCSDDFVPVEIQSSGSGDVTGLFGLK